jgi:serine/threonine protein kinase
MRLVDFGLARPFQQLANGASPTAPDQYVGTADYVAPELRYRNQPPDARADIYSLGVVMYETLTGRLPIGHFPAPSSVGKCGKHLDKIVLRCLATDPAARFPTAIDLRAALVDKRLRPVTLIIGAAAAVAVFFAIVCIYLYSTISSSTTSSSIPAAQQPPWAKHPSSQFPPVVAQQNPPQPFQPFSPGPSNPFQQSPPGQVSPQTFVPRIPATQSIPTASDEYVREVTNPFNHLPRFATPPFPTHNPLQPGARLIEQYGASRVVKISIRGLTDANRKSAFDELGRNGGHKFSASWSGNQTTAYVGPCDDVTGLAKTIDFGKVTKVDTATRTIEVEVPPSASTEAAPR